MRARDAAALVLLALVACKDKQQRAAEAAADPIYAALPADTAAVVTVSVERLRDTMVWPWLAASAGDLPLPVHEMRAACDIDLLQQVASITIVSDASLDGERAMLIVRGLAQERLNDCFVVLAAGAEGRHIAVTRDGPLTVFEEQESGQQNYAAWLDERTVMLMPADLADGERLRAAVEAPAKLAAEGELVALAGKVRASAAVSAVMIAAPGSEVHELLAMTGVSPKGLYLDLVLGPPLSARIGLRFGAAADASAAAAVLRPRLVAARAQLPIGESLPPFEVAAEGDEVLITWLLSEAQLEQLGPVIRALAE